MLLHFAHKWVCACECMHVYVCVSCVYECISVHVGDYMWRSEAKHNIPQDQSYWSFDIKSLTDMELTSKASRLRRKLCSLQFPSSQY